jgi:hypothetical protein
MPEIDKVNILSMHQHYGSGCTFIWQHSDTSILYVGDVRALQYNKKNGVFWDVMPCATWQNIPEDAILHSHHHENLKSYNIIIQMTTVLHINTLKTWNPKISFLNVCPVILHSSVLIFIYYRQWTYKYYGSWGHKGTKQKHTRNRINIKFIKLLITLRDVIHKT